MASPFIPIDRNCPIELPASLEGWLREEHLARFVGDIVEQLDLSAIEQVYRQQFSFCLARPHSTVKAQPKILALQAKMRIVGSIGAVVRWRIRRS